MKIKTISKWPLFLTIFAMGILFAYAGNDGIEGTDDDGDPICVDGELVENACISFKFSTGPMRNHVKAPSGILGLTSDFPSPTHSTPQALKVTTGMYGILRVVGNEVDILKKDGSKVTFTFPADSAEAGPADENSTWNASLKKVDADGNLSVTNAVTYDLYTFNGLERIRFSADTNSANYLLMVDFRTDEGQVYRADEFGMSYIYDEDGVIRQVMAPTRLLDFVVIDPYQYEVRFYEPQDVSMGTNGLYEVLSGAEPFEYWTVENPDTTNAYNRLNVSRTVGGTTRTFAFTYIAALHMWSSTKDGGETWQQTTLEWDASNVNGVRTSAWLADGDAPVEKWTKRLVNHSWGRAVMEKDDHVSATNSQITTYTYYTNAIETGRFRKAASEQRGDGTWDVYDYDSLKRKTLQISSRKDVAMTTNAALAKAVEYDYTPHEAADAPLEFDNRPRTVTEKIEGIVTKKTFFTYKTNSVGAQVHITETCVSPSASYGDVSNLRTVKTFYPPYDGDDFQDRLNSGRLKTTQSPDGQLITYEYALGDLTMDYGDPSAASFTASTNGLDWQVTVIHGTTNSPAGIAGKTVKEVPIKDEYNNVVLQQTYVYTGSGYERINWTVKEFDVYGHALNTWYSDGTQESGVWGTGCCGKDSGTDRQGIKTAYTYDLNKRMTSEVKLTTNDIAGVTTTYTYDAADRPLSIVLSATGTSALTNLVSYDMLGRPLQIINADETLRQRSYDDANLTVTETLPGGATRITTKYLDGKIKSITGTAVVAKTYDYGVNSDPANGGAGGTQWVKKYTGPDGTNSPMWTKTTIDLLGRTIQTEKPAFGGVVLTTKQIHNPKGQPTRIEQWVGDDLETVQIMEYDELGNRVRSGIDVDQDDELTLASMDRITDFDRQYVKENGDWFEQQLQIIYPHDNSSTALTNMVSKTRLTGLGGEALGFGLLTLETINLDRFGNQTVRRRYVDRAGRTVTQITDVPASTQDVVQVSVNGLLQSVTSAQSVVTEYTYDSFDRRISQFQVSGFTSQVSRTIGSTIHYNDLGQVDWQEDAASNRTWFSYDSDTGLKTAETNALGQTTLYDYNDRGQTTVVGGSSQYPVEYGYDDYGRMTDLYTLGATNGWDRTQWLYDQATGLVTNKLYPAAGGTGATGPSYTYTPEGKLATRTWARLYGSAPVATHYDYDSIGQLTNIVYSDDTPSVAIAYNRLGQKTQVIDASGTNTFAYSDTLLLTNETQLASFDLARYYDDFGRPTGYSVDEASSLVSYSYDDFGRFSAITSSVQSASSAVQYSYLPGSDLISGYTADGGLSVSYDFEANRNAKTSVINEFGTNLVSRFDYTYDPLMRRTQRIDSGSVTNDFGYNSRSELTNALMGVDSFAWEYDNIGNRVTASTNSTVLTYQANALNQYTQTTDNSSTNNYTYDADGNLLSDGTSTYTWNGENRLIEVSNATTVVTFKYDYRGRRFEKTVNATNTTRFVYDGWNLITEVAGSATNSYVWGLDLSQSLQGAGGVGGLLSVTTLTNSPASTFFTTYDANGNVAEYIDSTGTVVAHYVYDAYGNITATAGSKAGDFAFRFSTKYYDVETSLYYYGYRYYSPELGRWLSKDPLGERGGLNLYVFCGNNSVNFIDPKGLQSSDLVGDVDGGDSGLDLDYMDGINGNGDDDFDLSDIFGDQNANIDTDVPGTDLPGAYDPIIDPDVSELLNSFLDSFSPSYEPPLFIDFSGSDFIQNLLNDLWERENDPFYGLRGNCRVL